MNTEPVMVHVMFVLGNERAFGACKAFDVATHVFPIFHLRGGCKIALLTILSFSETSILLIYVVLRIYVRRILTKRRFVNVLCVMFR